MSDPYGKIFERFWTDPEIQALSERAQRILLYLFSNRHRRTVAGVYYLPMPIAAYELKLRVEDVELAVCDRLRAWVRYDPRTEEVWVRNLAAVNLDTSHDQPAPRSKDGKKEDSRLSALRKALAQVRSDYLRRWFLEYYAAWELGIPLPPSADAPTLTVIRGADAPSDAPSDGGPPGGERPFDASSSSCNSSSSSSSSRTVGSYDPTGAPVESVDQPKGPRAEAGRLMPVIRDCLYLPDGKPPDGYAEGRDFGILVELLEGGLRAPELEVGIRGLAAMRDAGEFERWTPPIKRGAKMTMRVLYHTRLGAVPMLTAAENWYYKHQEQPPAKGKHGQPAPLADLFVGVRG